VKFIPYGRQKIDRDDIDAVVKVLESDFLTQGPTIEKFEKLFCNKVKTRFAVSCANGTAALHLAMLAAGVDKGDRVIAPPITFVASANCARFNNADVIFADIDSNSLCLSPVRCEQELERAKKQNRKIKAVVTVDLAGHPCDMQAFSVLKKKYGFVWIQDACHSPGAQWVDNKGISRKTGEWDQPDFTVFSFHPVKHMTCGEGGMITTHSQDLAQKLRDFRTHGITKDFKRFSSPESAFDEEGNLNPWYYEMQVLGYNYRLTDIQAALGMSQLKKLDMFIARRREIVSQYQQKLADVGFLEFPRVHPDVKHAYHLAIVLIDFEKLKKSRAKVMNELKDLGIGTQVHYIPIPLMPYYSEPDCTAEIPEAMDYYRKTLSIPCFPAMTDEDVDMVCDAIKKVVK
jgi:UDP-4-amino-4,6-dideoxy-N-acetyl-beta-L-altrosamine transaminase